MATRKKLATAVARGTISIPSFDTQPESENTLPYCCGVLVIGSFGSTPASIEDMAEALYLDSYDLDDEDDYYDDNGNEKEIYDSKLRRYVANPKWVKPEPKAPDPRLRSIGLTKKEAKAFWDEFAKQQGKAQLLASLNTATQEFAAENLQNAGWVPLQTFESRSSRNLITLYGYTVDAYACTNPRF